MDQFDAFFRRADLDHDGRISGVEAVSFFQGSNLSKPVLAQIWQHADQNRTGFLGRQEFYNALKLVTVAQSKRELTPDIVKAALYGPASAKIPAPQINLAALPPGQPNSMAPRPPAQQPAVVNSMAPRPPTQQPGILNSMVPRPPTQQPGVVNSMTPRPPAQQPGIVPLTSEPQAPVKIDPLGALNAFTRQPTGGPVQSAAPSVSRPSQQGPPQNATYGTSEFSVETKTPASSLSQPQWPKMTRAGVNKYMKVFKEVDSDRDGKITGEQARTLFLSWKLPREILKQVWDLSDQDNDSMLSLREFCIALYLMERYREGHHLPPTLPSNVLLDETLLSLTGPPNPLYRQAGWGATPGSVPQQQGTPGGQPMPHAGLRNTIPGAQQMQSNQQKGPVPPIDSHADNISNGDQNSFHSVTREAAEAEKAVDEKVILDFREKMAFYRNKMQDLVLYKSRCDNRLNEITERALADKREAELLAKKYEEKYKQVAEVASKLTIEEASFRDIQERKMELNQAMVKMEQGGSADGILQVRADRIQSDLEELLKALTERCKKHGINVKSTAIMELPQGWQPGIPEISAVWDEDWDKFEDEGFQFDVAVPANTNSVSQAENSSPVDNYSQDSYSNADGQSEKPFETESAYAHSEDGSAKSPAASPKTRKLFESPTKEDSYTHFEKSFDADSERNFDDQGWGTFDNNDDVDSVWGFNNETTKEADHEKHGESYFFDSNSFTASPRTTDSPQGNSYLQKKSPFGFDDSVPGSPASRAAMSPRYSGGGAENSFFDNFSRYDSFSATDRGSPKQEIFSRFDSMSSTTQENTFSRFDSMSTTTAEDRNFARFDSMSSNAGFDHGQAYTFDDSDPFGSSGPFKVSTESQTGKNESDKWVF